MSVRKRLADDLAGSYDRVRQVLESAMDAEKRAWGFCPGCRKKVQVEVTDHAARIRAVELWLEQGLGRAGPASAQGPVGAEGELSDLRELSDDELAAYLWVNTTAEEREADRRLVERLGGEDLRGFAAARDRVEALAREVGVVD